MQLRLFTVFAIGVALFSAAAENQDQSKAPAVAVTRNETVPVVIRDVEELVAKLVCAGPIAVACIKECFARSRDVDIEAAVIFENEAATKCFVSADQQEGLKAFLEKRNPRWSGR